MSDLKTNIAYEIDTGDDLLEQLKKVNESRKSSDGLVGPEASDFGDVGLTAKGYHASNTKGGPLGGVVGEVKAFQKPFSSVVSNEAELINKNLDEQRTDLINQGNAMIAQKQAEDNQERINAANLKAAELSASAQRSAAKWGTVGTVVTVGAVLF